MWATATTELAALIRLPLPKAATNEHRPERFYLTNFITFAWITQTDFKSHVSKQLNELPLLKIIPQQADYFIFFPPLRYALFKLTEELATEQQMKANTNTLLNIFV